MRLVRFGVASLTWLAFAGAITYVAAQRFVGEATWQTTVLLYLPHALLLLPAAVIGALQALVGTRRLLIVTLATFVVLLFPIMGLSLGGERAPGNGPHLRLLTYNVDSGNRGVEEIVRQIAVAAPDIVLLQESTWAVDNAVEAALPGFSFHRYGQFFIASRYRIQRVTEPKRIDVHGVDRSPRYIGYTVDSALGPIDLWNVHPISPREGFNELRGEGLRHEIESGRIFAGEASQLVANTELRRLQTEDIAAAARRSTNGVIIAGDTNLPVASRILADNLGGYQDAFAEVGRGFGYTFPAHRYLPWMRIDRILAGPEFRFIRVQVGDLHGSDHYCVFADIEKR
jgi:endonuclease/exonuclease/phosphatase (EEP) superfamily protein YafD